MYPQVLELTHNHGTEDDPAFKVHNGNDEDPKADPPMLRGFGHTGVCVCVGGCAGGCVGGPGGREVSDVSVFILFPLCLYAFVPFLWMEGKVAWHCGAQYEALDLLYHLLYHLSYSAPSHIS